MAGRVVGFRSLAALFGCYFLFAAIMQANDPDVLAWGGIYAASAAVTFYAIWQLPPAWLPRSIAVVGTVWAVAIAPVAFKSSFDKLFSTWEMMGPRVETGREFLGLVILVVWMLALGRRAARAAWN